MKLSKKLTTFTLLFTLLLGYCFPVVSSAETTQKDSSSTAETTGIIMNKSEYSYGEQHATFTYQKSFGPTTWIAVFKRTDIPGKLNSQPLLLQYAQNMSQTNGVCDFSGFIGKKFENLQCGEYTLFLFVNNNYTAISKFNFTITRPDLSPPELVTYNRTATQKGYADGFVTVTPPEDATDITEYWVYWGNENGRLKNYSPFAKIPVNETQTFSKEISTNTIIPSGAKKIFAYSVSDGALSTAFIAIDIDKDIALSQETPLYSFETISDLHVKKDSDNEGNLHTDLALKDIKANDPDSIGIMGIGDITNGGEILEYQNLQSILKENQANLPKMYFIPGNHDLRGNWTVQKDKFNQYTGMNAPYYEIKTDQYTLIFLSSEQTGTAIDTSYLSPIQLSWLEQRLAAAVSGAKPVFVFHHQPLYNTTSGTFPGQKWDGVQQDAELRTILKKYPQALFFTGHTHWDLEAKGPIHFGDGNDATMINSGGVAALWTDDDKYKFGSQGNYIEVYKDKILVRGRDFINGEWISNAQFIVDITKNINSIANAVPTKDDGLIAQKPHITSLVDHINALPDEKRSEFTSATSHLYSLLNRIQVLENNVKNVNKSIDLLPGPLNVKKSDSAVINNVLKEYNALTKEQQLLVSADLMMKLRENEKVLNLLALGGWISLNEKWYYCWNGDKLKSCWGKINNKWYHFDSIGEMQINSWAKYGSQWCYVGSDGIMIINTWKNIKGKWYYFNNGGFMQTNSWVRYNSKWCYVGADGVMTTNSWKNIKSKWYHFDNSGYMQISQWIKYNSKWCYVGPGGIMLTNNWKCLNGKWYYLDTNGYMLASTSKKIGEKTYKFSSCGICINV